MWCFPATINCQPAVTFPAKMCSRAESTRWQYKILWHAGDFRLVHLIFTWKEEILPGNSACLHKPTVNLFYPKISTFCIVFSNVRFWCFFDRWDVNGGPTDRIKKSQFLNKNARKRTCRYCAVTDRVNYKANENN